MTVDGSASYDPDNGPSPLQFAWTLAGEPQLGAEPTANRAEPTASLIDANTARASFTPDREGQYRLVLTVSDGAASASDEVVITARAATPADIPILSELASWLVLLLLLGLALHALRRRPYRWR